MPTLYDALWFFLIYAFLGWCTEVVFEAMVHGRFINRGFLNGPVCPIYGFGVLIVVVLLTPLKAHLLPLFLGSVLLTSALEFATGFLLEKVFHDKWWDYSNEPFNIKGYVCLRFSVAWGLACVFVLDIVHPLIFELVSHIPPLLGNILLAVFFAALLTDFVVTLLAASKLKARLANMDALTAKLRIVSDGIGAPLAGQAIEFKDKLEEEKKEKQPEIDALEKKLAALADESQKIERRLLKAFPRLQRGRYAESVKHIRARFWEKQPAAEPAATDATAAK